MKFAGIDISPHMDLQKELWDTYGSQLMQCRRVVRSIFLTIIPKELKPEMLKEDSSVN